MSKPFNHSLNKDILSLKAHQGSKKETSYKQLMASVMQKYNISKATLYKELSKDVPGSYKQYETKGRAVPIGLKEANMVKDMLSRAISSEEIRKTMSIELGFSYSVRRLNKVKQHIKEGAILEGVRSFDTYSSPLNISRNEDTCKTKKIEINIDELKTSSELSNTLRKLNDEAGGKYGTSNPVVFFKGNLRKLFYRLSMLSKMQPNIPIRLNIYGYERKVNPRIIKGCLDQIAASASTDGMDADEIIRFNIQTILLNESNDYKRGFYISPRDIKSLESARRSLSSTSAAVNSPQSGGYALDDVLEAVKYFSPDVKREELMNYIKIKNMA